jgi:fused signal recognition particle receptor
MPSDRVTQASRLGFWGKLKRLALTDVGAMVRGFNAADIEAMEQTLLEADFGLAATGDLVDFLQQEVRRGRVKTEDELRQAVAGRIASILRFPLDGTGLVRAPTPPTVIVVVGVNGVGKTTTVAKLAHRLTGEGRRVLLAAADTWRAGAVAQLETWAERLNLPCVSGKQGGDPAAVAYDALEAATSRGADTVLIDTAGRLHTQEGLMDELRKVVRVIAKRIPGAPHETLLVLDGTVGQNAIQQGRLFLQAVAPTGLIVTKLDGTARGGAVVALRRELQIPIRFLGRGEGIEDLEMFDAARFADLLVR